MSFRGGLASLKQTTRWCRRRLRPVKCLRIFCLSVGIYAFIALIWPSHSIHRQLVVQQLISKRKIFDNYGLLSNKINITNNNTDPTIAITTNYYKDDMNISFHVTYSEKLVQLQLKSIHEHGFKSLNLRTDTCRQRLPQCLIIGNYKSGTQELLEFMYMHPRIRIYREPLIETNFFAGQYSKGIEWYRKQMPCSVQGQITVEKSACYLQEPDTPARIHAMNSSIRLIVLFREPISRAVSHFSFSQHIAKRYGNKFDTCAINSTSGEINRNCFAIKHSIYDEGMERYLKYFNRSQIKILDAVEFKRDPYKVLHDVESFLNIEHIIEPEQFVFIKEKGFHCVRSIENKANVVCYDARRGRKNRTSPVETMNKTTLSKLQEHFKQRNERLFKLIDRTFDWQYS